MIRQDLDGNLWNRGTKLGLIYSLIAILIHGLTMDQEPDGQLALLEKFRFLVWLAPLAAASHAYVAGQLSQKQLKNQEES